VEIIHQETVDLERVADLCAVGIKHSPPTPRNFQKWHITNLIASAKLITQGDVRYSGDNEVLPSIRALGYLGRIWETAIDCYLTDWAVNRGGVYLPDTELEEEGIIASLDGLAFLPDLGSMITETKLRFSIKDEIPMSHLQQVRAYCHLARVDQVCYVSGHISTAPPTAKAQLRILKLTERSIQETWEMIINTKKYLEGLGITPSSKYVMEDS